MLLLERIFQDLDTRTSQEPPTRAFIQAPLICTIFVQGPLREYLTSISTRSSAQDLYRIMQVLIRKEFSGIPTRARLCENLQRKSRRPRARKADFVRACAEMHHGHLRRTRLCENPPPACRRVLWMFFWYIFRSAKSLDPPLLTPLSPPAAWPATQPAPCYLFCFTCLHNAFMHVGMYT